MLSTFFPPDPTLTVENVGQVTEKVELKLKMQVWNDVLQCEDIENISHRKCSFKKEECADIYVNCHPHSSWELLAKALYEHHQLAAVDEVRSYLPPRGEPCFWSACIYYTGSFNSHTEILRN